MLAGLLLLIVVLLILRQPVLVILIAALVYSHLVWGDAALRFLALDAWDALNKDILLSVPLYLLAGKLMSSGSFAARITDLLRELTIAIPGGLALAALLVCAIFSAMSGSSTVTLLAVGAVFHPALRDAGYPPSFSIGLLCAGGTLGIIIPPSIPLILYGVMTRVSIVDLFMAGLGPAALILLFFALYTLWVCRHQARGQFDARRCVLALRRSALALLAPLLILGSIYGGFCTATEAAVIAVCYTLLVQLLVYRDQGVRDVLIAVEETSRLIGSLFPVLMLAVCLNMLLSYQQLPPALIGWVSQHVSSQHSFLLLTNLLLLAVGCVVDIGSAVLILAPLLKPLAASVGIDSVHMGIMMIVNLEVGYLTPPLGLNLIVAMGAFGVSFLVVCRAVLPFIALMLLALAVVALYPPLSLFLL